MVEGSGTAGSMEGLHGRSRACIEAGRELAFQIKRAGKKLGTGGLSKATKMITMMLNAKKL